MFGSQDPGSCSGSKTWGNVQGPQVLPCKGGQKGGAQASLVSGGFVSARLGLGAGKKKTTWKLQGSSF